MPGADIDTIASIAPGMRANIVAVVLGESVSVRLAREGGEVDVAEFELSDATGRVRAVTVSRDTAHTLRKAVGTPLLCIDAAVHAVPIKPSELCLRILLSHSTTLLSLAEVPSQETLLELVCKAERTRWKDLVGKPIGMEIDLNKGSFFLKENRRRSCKIFLKVLKKNTPFHRRRTTALRTQQS